MSIELPETADTALFECNANDMYHEDSDADDVESMYNTTAYSWSLYGSDVPASTGQPSKVFCTTWEQFFEALSKTSTGKMDVVEPFGGPHGAVLQLSVKRGLKAGCNFDIAMNVDLTKTSDIQGLFHYLKVHKPRVIIAGPPCTSFGGWSFLNRIKHPATWLATRKIGELLANITAYACNMQLDRGDHFLVENPLGSEMWTMPAWRNLLRLACVVTAVCDQ
jgi:hypothetical protein